jgi:hypothetical protein
MKLIQKPTDLEKNLAMGGSEARVVNCIEGQSPLEVYLRSSKPVTRLEKKVGDQFRGLLPGIARRKQRQGEVLSQQLSN